MTFYHNNVKSPDNGDKRTITKFATWPVKAGYESRWFETVTVEQEYVCAGCADVYYAAWENRKFIDKE